jgi:hypothetical protein
LGSIAPEPLGVSEAKARLRATAAAVNVSALAPVEPRRALLLALLAGILVGSSAESRAMLAKVLMGVLFDSD